MRKKLEDQLDDTEQVQRHGDKITVGLWYPRQPGQVNCIEVELVDVRAADSIRISYDFDRDGYKIEQASYFGPWGLDEEPDMGWQEVAFIKAWALEKKDEGGP